MGDGIIIVGQLYFYMLVHDACWLTQGPSKYESVSQSNPWNNGEVLGIVDYSSH